MKKYKKKKKRTIEKCVTAAHWATMKVKIAKVKEKGSALKMATTSSESNHTFEVLLLLCVKFS